MAHTEHTIYIHPLAPAKVVAGAACNGCGVCCLYAPCPLGVLLSRRRTGACGALRWDAPLSQYRCGAITVPQAVLAQSLPRGLRGLAPMLAPVLRRVGLRWIAAGIGCDSDLKVEQPRPDKPDAGVCDPTSTTMQPPNLPNPIHRTVVRHSPP